MRPCLKPEIGTWLDQSKSNFDLEYTDWGWCMRSPRDEKGSYICFNMNDPDESYASDGLYEVKYLVGGGSRFKPANLLHEVLHLERLFRYPLFPTTEEVALFEIEYNLKYPIPVQEEINE